MSSKKSWSEAEKMDIFFQIVAIVGTIPWDKIKLAEGRTVKAASMMIEREKNKLKPHAGKDKTDSPQTPSQISPAKAKSKKRSAKEAEADDEEITTGFKKVKTPTQRKKSAQPAQEAKVEGNIDVSAGEDSGDDGYTLDQIKEELNLDDEV